ncbi:MAG: ferritin family protein [candidate division Zixibacteria bacterium]|jgi:rubrerythrin|nr:ferritin family protein [candidate division Zixibacteria bacterium]
MNVEKAIKTAIEFENRVRDVYRQAFNKAGDEVGKRVFKALADEEQQHVDYLNSRLELWRKQGDLDFGKLETSVPSKSTIANGLAKLRGHIKETDRGAELQLLNRALDIEMETSDFYRRMVDEMDAEPRKMFARFLEIEEGHQAIVKAEIDALTGMGVWFDFIEFDLESN